MSQIYRQGVGSSSEQSGKSSKSVHMPANQLKVRVRATTYHTSKYARDKDCDAQLKFRILRAPVLGSWTQPYIHLIRLGESHCLALLHSQTR